MQVKKPTAKTLAKYGLSDQDWNVLVSKQKGVCAVCGKLPKSGRLCIEHEHVRGWKRMPDTERKRYVRGLSCFGCNKYLIAKNTKETIDLVSAYLKGAK